MARQKGILKIEGTIGGMTFYKSQDGHLIREKGGVSGDKIANDPAFQRTRENGREFGNAGISGKLLRDALRSMMMTAADGRVTSRLTKVMTQIVKEDVLSQRGDRTVSEGIRSPEGRLLLKGFDFNIKAIMGSILFKPYTLNPATGEIAINGLNPINDIAYPKGATHVTLRAAFARVNFNTGDSSVEFSNTENAVIGTNFLNVLLTPAAVPPGTGTAIHLLQIEFFQEVNGMQYSLKNGSYNALQIVEVL